MKYDTDYVLCECELPPLQALVVGLEQAHRIAIVKEPSVCLTMIRAEDSLEQQEFFLGEALTTECEVSVDGRIGYGVCLGDEPVRGYCLAVVDAILHGGSDTIADVHPFIDRQRALIAARETEEFNLILRTQVDFKLMEQE
jgi:alpha-D-ribose 1-methylphosphonate 5-triphosphate synthase subunit PhnG